VSLASLSEPSSLDSAPADPSSDSAAAGGASAGGVTFASCCGARCGRSSNGDSVATAIVARMKASGDEDRVLHGPWIRRYLRPKCLNGPLTFAA
jgi:hypothetical protein